MPFAHLQPYEQVNHAPEARDKSPGHKILAFTLYTSCNPYQYWFFELSLLSYIERVRR